MNKWNSQLNKWDSQLNKCIFLPSNKWISLSYKYISLQNKWCKESFWLKNALVNFKLYLLYTEWGTLPRRSWIAGAANTRSIGLYLCGCDALTIIVSHRWSEADSLLGPDKKQDPNYLIDLWLFSILEIFVVIFMTNRCTFTCYFSDFNLWKPNKYFLNFHVIWKRAWSKKKVSCFLAVDLDRSKEMADFIDSSNGCMK